MNILVTGANGQLGNEMRIISKGSSDKYIFTDVNQVEGLETTYLDITDLEAIRKIVADKNVDAIVNCAAWTNVDGAEDPEKYTLVERLNATAPENLAKAMKEVDGWCKYLQITFLAKNHTTHHVRKTRKVRLLEFMALPNFLGNRRSLLRDVNI